MNAFSLIATAPDLLTRSYSADSSSPIAIVIGLAVSIFFIAVYWRIFTKAGEPGWASIVPIYNIIVMLKIVGRPLWWILLLLIPFVNIIIIILLVIDLAKAFGKGGGFAVGLLFLGFIFLPILAFGDAQYQGPPH